jgi:hypothetical protein
MFLKQSRSTEQIVFPRFTDEEEDEDLNGIRCPKCSWRPMQSDRWCCLTLDTPEPPFDFCMTTWNTFSTHGRCPGCQHQWMWTSCLRCEQWSLHEEWYERGR